MVVSFLHPEFIYLMLPALIILFALLLTQREVQEQFFSSRVLAKLRVDTKRLSARVRNVFYFLMFLFIILALAAPVIEKGEAEVKVKGDLFFVALDLSDSMRCKDVYPSRLQVAKQKLLALLKQDRNDRIGLIAFAADHGPCAACIFAQTDGEHSYYRTGDQYFHPAQGCRSAPCRGGGEKTADHQRRRRQQ